MKKINVLVLGVCVLFAGFFGSCKKDEANDASISLAGDTGYTAADATVTAGGTFKVKWTATSTIDMKYVTITKDDGILASWNYIEIASGSSTTYINEATITVPASGGPYTYAIVVYDKDKVELARKEIVITIGAAATLKSYTATLYNGLWYTDSGKGAFIDLETGITYSQTSSGAILSAADQAKVDLLYWYGATTTYTLAAPNDATAQGSVGDAATKSWTTRNATKLKLVSVSQVWADLTVANVDSYATSFGTDTKEINLTVGTVIAFQTVGGKNGLIKVDAVSGTSQSKTDNASVSVVVEQ